jgi:hypothetical protein
MALSLRDRRIYRADEKENHRLLKDDERKRLLEVRFFNSYMQLKPRVL